MNRTLIATTLAAALVGVMGVAPVASAASVGASVGAYGGGVGAGVQASTSVSLKSGLLTRAKDRANQEIQRRVENLTKLQTRFSEMKHISASDQSGLEATVQAQIQAMNTLESQIAADDSTTTLRADIQSITKSYRIYALVIPQSALIAAADRVLSVATQLATISGKLSARISAAATAGADVSAMNTSLADMNAKIADAQTQANAAVSAVVVLKPDNGVQTVMQANLATMKDVRTKIQAAQQDLVAARKDAGDIVKALKGLGGSASATSTASASTTP